jgi:hypothetical protein
MTRESETENVLDKSFMNDVVKELHRARTKFPNANLAFVALVEEVGELAQAKLKFSAGTWSHDRVWQEAVQVAAMAMRVAIEGDASFAVNYTEPK